MPSNLLDIKSEIWRRFQGYCFKHCQHLRYYVSCKTLRNIWLQKIMGICGISKQSPGGLLSKTCLPDSCNFIEKETPTQVFSCEFCEIFKNSISYRTSPVAVSAVLITEINTSPQRLLTKKFMKS